jgi:NADH-quinone oxidoreductase subunit I
MYGVGILKGLGVTLKHFIDTYVDDLRYGMKKYTNEEGQFQRRQGPDAQGIFTVEYPDEKIAVPERFRFVPFLVVNDEDHPDAPGQDWCTSCGICAKVCPPQCIWIVRGQDPVTKRPVPEPEAFYIDIDICMNCGYCAEFCPFDAIKMDHDYELSSYDRTLAHIYDKPKLQKPFTYWRSIAPTTAAEEAQDRGGWEHKDVISARQKAEKEAARKSAAEAEAAAKADAPASPQAEAIPAAVEQAVGQAQAGSTPAQNEVPAASAAAAAQDTNSEDAKAARLAKREAALARKRAKAEGGDAADGGDKSE